MQHYATMNTRQRSVPSEITPMFTALTTAVTTNLAQVADLAQQIENQQLSWKRLAAARYIEYYAKVCDVEQAFVAAFGELDVLVSNDRIPTKVVIRRKLAVLHYSLEEFGQSTIGIYALPPFSSAQPDPFLVPLAGPKSFWFSHPTVANLYPVICPSSIVEHGRATYVVTYPTELPTLQRIEVEHYRIQSRDEQRTREVEQRLRADIQQIISYQNVDIRDKHNLGLAIATVPVQMNAIEVARKRLATTIHKHFELTVILT